MENREYSSPTIASVGLMPIGLVVVGFIFIVV